jgi:dTDP-4-amino-4,6-dideoxygalactose transaminase
MTEKRADFASGSDFVAKPPRPNAQPPRAVPLADSYGSSQDAPLYVTKPSLPPLPAVVRLLEGVWDRRILTNGGPLHQKLERALEQYLGVPHVSLFANATVALITALKALEIRGEVITTPFSFVATGHSLLWNGLVPVFCDIDPNTLNIDVRKLEGLITPNTTAIMPVHCYGHPCDTDGIRDIASRNGLNVIYDAAHAFGVTDAGGALARHGDLSVLSFHATKVFNTFEGGAIVSQSLEMKSRIDKLKNFGFEDEVTVSEVGINGKMSELHAAVGLCQLERVDADIAARAMIAQEYRERLASIRGVRCIGPTTETRENHSYFPILVQPAFPISRDELYARLQTRRIFTRRYFYPLIPTFAMYRDRMTGQATGLPVAKQVASEVLCLPMSSEMKVPDAKRVCDAIRSTS